MIECNYINGVCGSGKTQSLISDISRDASTKKDKHLIIVPTKVLAEQSYNDLQRKSKNNVSIHLIIGDETQELSVIRRIQDVFNNYSTSPNGQIVIITQTAYSMLPDQYLKYKSNWHCYVDEPEPINGYFDINIDHFYKDILSLMNRRDIGIPGIYHIEPSYRTRLKTIITTGKDSQRDIIKPLLSKLLSKHEDVYIISGNLDEFTVKRDTNLDNNDPYVKYSERKSASLSFLSIRKPSYYDGFKSLSFLSATFTEELMCKIWGPKYNIKFYQSSRNNITKQTHENGQYLNLYYYSEHYSRTLANKVLYSGETYKETLLKKFLSKLNEVSDYNEALYLGNNGDEILVKRLFDENNVRCTRIPVKSHGQNCYSHINNFILGGSYLLTPQHINLLKLVVGVTDDDIRLVNNSIAYQGIMRGALRNNDCRVEQHCFVPDKATAEFIASKFDTCTLICMDDGSIKKPSRVDKKFDNNADKQKSYRQNKLKEEVMNEYNYFNDDFNNTKGITSLSTNLEKKYAKNNNYDYVSLPNYYTIDSFLVNEKESYDAILRKDRFFMSLYLGKSAIKTENHIFYNSRDQLKSIIEQFSSSEYNSKRDNDIVYYGPGLTNNIGFYKETKNNIDMYTYRSSINMIYAETLVLDVDGGDMSSFDFRRVFGNLSFIIHSTASTTETNNKFRVILFLDSRVGRKSYSKVFNYIVNVLAINGYHTEKREQSDLVHGIDMSKSKIESLFASPGKYRNAHNYIHFYEGSEMDVKEILLMSEYKIPKMVVETIERVADKLDIEEVELTDNIIEIIDDIKINSSNDNIFRNVGRLFQYCKSKNIRKGLILPYITDVVLSVKPNREKKYINLIERQLRSTGYHLIE